ncbi:cellulose synthase catalytic subunit (UDP-forming) [compost metagenome]
MFTLFLENQSLLAINGGVLLAMVLLTLLCRQERPADRMLFGGITFLLLMVYLTWRVRETLPPWQPTFASAWAHVFFAFECMTLAYTLLSIVVLSRNSNHSPAADAGESALRRAAHVPRVDIFIATYNEGLDILEKTIVSALAIDYPDFRVWVLDDTRRDWLREFCGRVGAYYVTRPDNAHAKAGNLNNGLRHSAEAGGAPYILVLDADFAPHRNILLRTVGLFDDPRVGVVQTPQFYYNADPIQYNLRATECWVDEQRAFFDVMQPAKDAWGAAFCIGTSFVVRRDLIEQIGGFPTGTVTEDIHLTYRLLPHGYITRWLNERLSVGLSAEGLPEYISQRSRWGLGTVQVALTADGPLRGRGYTAVQRLHYVHGLLHWMSRPFTLMLLAGPLLYWYFGVSTLYGEPLQFLAYGLHHRPARAADLHRSHADRRVAGGDGVAGQRDVQAVRAAVQGHQQGAGSLEAGDPRQVRGAVREPAGVIRAGTGARAGGRRRCAGAGLQYGMDGHCADALPGFVPGVRGAAAAAQGRAFPASRRGLAARGRA